MSRGHLLEQTGCRQSPNDGSEEGEVGAVEEFVSW